MKNFISDHDYESARATGRSEMAQTHAVEASFMPRHAVLRIKFSNGLSLLMDVRQIPEFQGLSLSALRNPYVTPGGDGLIFQEANLAFHLPNLLAPYLPLELARSRVAAELGKTRSDKKAAAARVNGAKGGRPRKMTAASVSGSAVV